MEILQFSALTALAAIVTTLALLECHKTKIFRRKVAEALDRALENGYDMRRERPLIVAKDMIDHDAGFEGYDPQELLDPIKRWQEA